MNFIEEVMERTPASTLGIVAIDSRGNRREWHHGELIARSAGLSGAMAARGVGRGDAVMKGLNTAVWPLTGYTFIGTTRSAPTSAFAGSTEREFPRPIPRRRPGEPGIDFRGHPGETSRMLAEALGGGPRFRRG
jgi:hypothetical protein